MAELPIVEEVPRIREFPRFNMFAPRIDGCTGMPKLSFAELEGNPRVTVYTNNSNDNINKGIISAPMNPVTFFIFLDELIDIAKGPSGTVSRVECKTRERLPDGKFGDIIPNTELLYGKDDEGMVWIGVRGKDRPNIKFEFKLSDFHRFIKPNKEPMSATEASCAQAIGTAECLKKVYGNVIGNTNKLGGNRNNNNSGIRQQNNYQQNTSQSRPASTSAEFDDVF